MVGDIILALMVTASAALVGVAAYSYTTTRNEADASIAASQKAKAVALAQVATDIAQLEGATRGDVVSPEIFEKGDVSDAVMIEFYVRAHNKNLDPKGSAPFGWTNERLRWHDAIIDSEIQRRHLNTQAVAAFFASEGVQ